MKYVYTFICMYQYKHILYVFVLPLAIQEESTRYTMKKHWTLGGNCIDLFQEQKNIYK